MTLPRINVPEYSLVVPSTDEEIKFRPFLVKEEKLLLMAQETGADASLYSAIKNLIKNCCFDKIEVDRLPLFDIEYIFLQIRAKSVEEIAKLKVICPDDGVTEVGIEVDLTKLQVQMDDDHNPRIQLSDDIGLLMSYPNLSTVISVNEDDPDNTYETMFKMIQDCMYQIWQGEETFDVMDYSDADKKTFLESLNHNQFAKIQTFFETMPALKHEVEITNPKTQIKSTVTIEGMNSFF